MDDSRCQSSSIASKPASNSGRRFSPAGPIARLQVEDVGRAGEYAAVIRQVAAADYTLRPLAGYSLTVAR